MKATSPGLNGGVNPAQERCRKAKVVKVSAKAKKAENIAGRKKWSELRGIFDLASTCVAG